MDEFLKSLQDAPTSEIDDLVQYCTDLQYSLATKSKVKPELTEQYSVFKSHEVKKEVIDIQPGAVPELIPAALRDQRSLQDVKSENVDSERVDSEIVDSEIVDSDLQDSMLGVVPEAIQPSFYSDKLRTKASVKGTNYLPYSKRQRTDGVRREMSPVPDEELPTSSKKKTVSKMSKKLSNDHEGRTPVL